MPTYDRLLYSRRDAAQMLNICLRSLDSAIKRGDIVTRRLGRRVLIPWQEIDRLVGDSKT